MAIRGQSISVCYTAWDTQANAPKTGDVANHTLRLIKDGTSAAPTNGAAEVDAANAPGQYKITLTAAEMTCDTMVICGKSATANIVLIPVQIVTEHGYLPTNLDTNVGSRLVSGPVTVGTNNDKTGYSLTVTPPTAVQVRQEMDANSTQLAGIKAKTDNLPSGIRRNTALNNFEFPMTDLSGNPVSLLIVSAQVSIDGAAYVNCTNAVVEVGSGTYKINLAAADLNGGVVMLKFAAVGAKQRNFTIVTEQ